MWWSIERKKVCWLLACLLVACGGREQELSGRKAGIVARVDSLEIAAGEVREFVDGIPAGLRPQGDAADVRQAYLRSLIAKYLLQLEAEKRGLDTLKTVRESVEKRWQQRLIQQYRKEVLGPRVEVSQEEIRRYSEEHQLRRRRLLAGILGEEKDRAEEVVRQLDAGAGFAELAREYSIDERSAAQDGVVGYISPEQAHRLRIPEEVFRLLPPGKHSGVLPMGPRFQVVCFLGDSLAEMAEVAAKVGLELRERRLAVLEQQQVDSLAGELAWEMDPKGVDLLVSRAAGKKVFMRRNLLPEEADQTLFTFRGGRVALGQYLDALWGQPMRALSGWGLGDSAAVRQAAGEVVLRPAMLLQAAQRAGIGEDEEAQRWRKQVEQEYAIKELRRQEVVRKVEVSQAETRDFYEEHEILFREAESFYLVEVLVETEAEARDLLAELEKGETLSSLAQQRSIRPGMREKAGLLNLHGTDRLVDPQLFGAAREAEIGELVGPVQTREGYSVFEVLHREGGESTPFAQAERRASAFVRRQKKDRLFEELVDRLMDEYRERWAVDRERLAAALPDTLLERLEREAKSRNDG